MSAVSTVAPPQTRRPGGASRWAPISKATPSASRSAAIRAAAPPCPSASRPANHGATSLRQIDVDERVSGTSARNAAQSLASTQRATAARLACERAMSASSPPIDSAQASASSTSSTHSIDGVLRVRPSKIASSSRPPAVRRKIFGNGHGGTWLSSRSTARGDRISMPCAASPPSTFCHEKVAASSLSHGSAMANAAEVASQIVSPARPAEIHAPSGTRTPEVVPFHTNTTSRSQSTCARSGSLP